MTARDKVEGLLDSYAAAVRAKDVDALMALYAKDVCVFDAWGRWSYSSGNEWRGVVTEWFGSLGDDTVVVEWDDLRTVIGEGVAAVNAIVTYKGLSPDGTELRAMINRLTWALKRADDGGWKIVHEHTSAPVDVETSKVILTR